MSATSATAKAERIYYFFSLRTKENQKENKAKGGTTDALLQLAAQPSGLSPYPLFP
jgi:hypothetical protein